MGGQACISYGAAEFTRDIDLAIVASPRNLSALRDALDDLRAEVIAVPPFELKYLRKGHAIHFRCHHPEAEGLRVDVMSRMREVDPFHKLWSRRSTAELPDGTRFDLLSLPDLVQAKKTQRDKDWPMIRRLVEADLFARQENPSAADVSFWLLELRTPEFLISVAAAYAEACRRLIPKRPLLDSALRGDDSALVSALAAEEQREREEDREYWAPLRRELELLRRSRARAIDEDDHNG